MKKIIALLTCICSLGACTACDKLLGGSSDLNSDSIESTESVDMSEEYGFEIVSQFDEPVSLLDNAVLSYLQSDGNEMVTSFLPSGSYRLDKGNPVVFQYDVKALRDVALAQVEVSTDENFANIVATENFLMRDTQAYVYNLMPGTHYYFRISVFMNDGATLTKSGEFSTAQSLRFISLDGASNVRDIGGWKTESGKTIKYGMLFRGGEIDGGKNTGHPDFRLTKEGIAQLRAFGIKTDLDLRSEDVKVSEFSILGSDVTRTFYDAAQYEAILKPSNAEKIRKIFSTLAKPEAYPVYLHCTHGVDRAGSTTMMLEALLGVAKADLIRDYELSAFYHNYKHVNRELNNGGTLLALIAGLEAYEGETLADKTANFLLSVGVTQAEIDSIRNILLN